jgi:hypothetical protein
VIALIKVKAMWIESDLKKSVLSICTLLLFLALVSCGSGGGTGEEAGTTTPNFPPVVFSADKDTDGTVELYASFNDGTEIIKLSGTMVPGGNVVDFKVSPDGIYVAYVADQEANNVFELYAVPVDKAPGETAVKISGAMAGNGLKEVAAGSGDYFFAWALDSSRIAYIADQNAVGVFELFSSTPDGSDNVQVSGTLVSGGDVLDFEWEPASALIAYVADQNTNNVQELYVSPADSDTPNVLVSGTVMAGSGIKLISEGVYSFAWSPDSAWLAYIADQVLATKFELFTARPDGSNNVQVSGPLDSNRDVDAFAWSPQSDRIVYRANQSNLNALELYTVYPSIALSSQQITSGFGPGQNVLQFGWSPTIINLEQRIAFIADKNTTDVFQLYTTSPNNSLNVLVSSVVPAGGDVKEFAWAPDGVLLAYRGDTRTDEVEELFTTGRSAPLVRAISFLVPSGGDVFDFAWAPDGSRIAYRADQRTDNVIELFTNTPKGNQISNERISGGPAPGGNVTEFQWAPDSSGVGYIADQNTDEVFELFVSLPAGGDNTLLSGSLVNGGDVFAFEWVP